MDPLIGIFQRLRDLEHRVPAMMRPATVVDVDAETARLTCESEGLEQTDIPLLTTRAGEDMSYWLPSPGELGFLLSPSGDTANAVFLPAIFYDDFPVPEKNAAIVKRLFRGDIEEEIDTTIGKWKLKVKMNEMILDPILLYLLGVQIFSSGLTNLQSPMGPIFFAPVPPTETPSAPPPPPSGSEPDSDGNATKIPPQTNEDLEITAGTIDFTIPPLTVTGTAGPYPVTGQTAATPASLQFTADGVTLVIPAQDL